MLHKNAKVELLKGVPLFSGCSRRQLGEIAAIANEIEFADGEVLIYEKDLGGRFFVVIDGDVEVTKQGERVDVLGGTEFFGEMSLLLSGRRTRR
jgi:CRP-like cAMP-binding protein